MSSIGGATLAGFDLPTAQKLFDKDGKLDQIRVAEKDGVSPGAARREIRDDPAAGHAGADRRRAGGGGRGGHERFISFLQKFLLGFGGIALFVGAFVIANSLSITIAQRTREFATLRTLGASRRQVRFSVHRSRPSSIGTLASIVGLFLGLALAKGLFWLFDAVGFTLPNNGLLFEPRTIVVSLLVGILVTRARRPAPGVPRHARAADRRRA